MKINYYLNSDSTIKSWRSIPLIQSEPIIEVDDPDTIKLDFDKVINGKLVKDIDGYNQEEKKRNAIINKLSRIQQLKQLLNDSDYKIMKYLEGNLTKEEFTQIKAIRQGYRDEINQLESELALLKK